MDVLFSGIFNEFHVLCPTQHILTILASFPVVTLSFPPLCVSVHMLKLDIAPTLVRTVGIRNIEDGIRNKICMYYIYVHLVVWTHAEHLH